MTRVTIFRPMIVLWLVVIVAGACSASSASTTPNATASSSPVGAATTARSPTPITTSAPTEVPRSSSQPFASPTARVSPDTIAVTIEDRIRVRSKPSVSDDSIKFDPLLPLGTTLYVLDGPVSASGYAWYEVVQLTSRTLPSGWIASADRDGQPWIEAGAFDCPPVPTDVRSLAALVPGVGLACFPQVPITVQARLLECNCDADGSWYSPSWFFLGSGSPNLLADPDMTRPPDSAKPDEWFALNLDPTGDHPAVLPIGKVVQVTGMFDHPAAASCTLTQMDGEPAPSHGCRLEFAVTKLAVRR